MENFDAKNMMMTVKYWQDGPDEESGEPRSSMKQESPNSLLETT